jgi:hypothetical protein
MSVAIVPITRPTKRAYEGSLKVTGLMDKPHPGMVTPGELLQWREGQNLDITPKFQRRSVWSVEQRSYLIDTILQKMPVPPLYIRNFYKSKSKKVVHQIIDGQQRLRAVLEFIDDEYRISKKLSVPYSHKRFSDLSRVQQRAILTFPFSYQAFEAISDEEVYDVFRRMNTYSTPLNPQELRHGRFFGPFCQACEKLAREHYQFWRSNKIFTNKRIARMAEVQLTSSLLICQIDGMQDLNRSITDFYDKYDDKFSERRQNENRFRDVIESISTLYGDDLRESQFRKPVFFHTLFCVLYHRMFGLPKTKLRTPRRHLSTNESESLRNAADKLSEVISIAREQQQVDKDAGIRVNPLRYRDFIAACLSQTDNIKPRTTRFETLYKEAFG